MKIINPKFQALNIHFNLFDRPWNIGHLFWDTLYYPNDRNSTYKKIKEELYLQE